MVSNNDSFNFSQLQYTPGAGTLQPTPKNPEMPHIESCFETENHFS
jgi:hypothetical protein